MKYFFYLMKYVSKISFQYIINLDYNSFREIENVTKKCSRTAKFSIEGL